MTSVPADGQCIPVDIDFAYKSPAEGTTFDTWCGRKIPVGGSSGFQLTSHEPVYRSLGHALQAIVTERRVPCGACLRAVRMRLHAAAEIERLFRTIGDNDNEGSPP